MSRIKTFANGFQMRVGKPTPEELHAFYRRTDTPKAMANYRKPSNAATQAFSAGKLADHAEANAFANTDAKPADAETAPTERPSTD